MYRPFSVVLLLFLYSIAKDYGSCKRGRSESLDQLPGRVDHWSFRAARRPPALFAVDSEGLWLIVSYAVLFFTIAINLYFYAFTALKSWIIASFLSLEVVAVLLLSFLLLNQKPEPIQLSGAVIVLATTVAISVREHVGVDKGQ